VPGLVGVNNGGEVSCPVCWAPNPPNNRHCQECAARLGYRGADVRTTGTAASAPWMSLYGIAVAAVAVAAVVIVAFSLVTRGLEPPDGATAGAAAPGTSSPTPATSLGSTSSTTPSRSGPLTPATISASTELSDEFGVDNLTDGDLSSAWNDASLHGDGATLTFDFGREVILDEIVITNLADEARFQRNFRVREYSIEIDGLAETIAGELGDVSGRQAIDIGGRNATKVTMRIVSTYAASELEGSPPFDELAIAEVSFTGR